MVSSSTRVIQITNIAPQATKDQMQTLFGYLGKIDDIRLYPTIRDVSCPVQSRICYVKYYDSSTVSVAQHMTNTVFIDRALIVIPMQTGEIPDEQRALELSNNGTIVPGLSNSEPRLPAHVENTLDGVPPNQVVLTTDPNLAAAGLPPYPPLPASCDTKTIEEIRRTVLVVDTGSLGHQQLIDYFGKAGEVKYLRFCERDDKLKYALIEMSEQESIIKALQLNSTTLDGHTIKVQHATQAINKPQTKSNEAAQREIEEAMCRVKEAQTLISAAIDPVIGLLSKDKRRTRSRSRSRRRSRSRSRRSRSRRKRSRSRSRHRSRRSRSRSRHRHRSRSRSRHRSSRRSRSRSRHRSSRSKRDRSRDRDRKDKDKKESDKDKKESDKDKKDRSKSPVKVEKAMSKSPPKDVEEKKPDDQKEPKPETNNGHSDGSPKAAEVIQSSVDKEVAAEVKAPEPEKEEEKSEEKKKERSPSRRKERSRSKDRKRDRSRSKRRSRSRSRKKRSRSRRRSRSRDRKRSRSRDRKKRSRSRKRSRDRSRDRKRSRSRDRKRTRSRDRKRSRSRDRKRSRSASRRSRSHRDSKTPHDMKSRERSPLPPLPEEKGKSIVDNSIDIEEEKNSPDNMDISNSP